MRSLFLHRNLWIGGALAASAALSVGVSGCDSGSEDGIEGSTCVSTQERFAVAYAKNLKKNCGACHAEGSIGANQSTYDLAPSSEAGFLDKNLEAVRTVANIYGADGKSRFLEKPLGNLEHGGGKIFESEEDPEYQELVKLVAQLKETSDSCPNTEARFLAGVQMAGPEETFRKAALSLAARLPTDEEEAAVTAGGWAAVDQLMAQLMLEDAFYERLKEKYNDVMLTDFYLNDDFDVIGGSETYNPRWYEDQTMGDDDEIFIPAEIDVYDPAMIQKYGATSGDDLREKFARWTQTGVARGALELIAHIVRNDKSFQEVANADYMVVNPFSARAYRIPAEEQVFENDADPNEFIEVKFGYDSETPYPHAGYFTDPIWLQRHPTTATNRNRHRAKEIAYVLLGNDILKAAERPIAIDASTLSDNPTFNNENCSVCHAYVDPIAGAFRNFQPTFDNNDDEQFTYRPVSTWFPEMAQTGFSGSPAPTPYTDTTKWLGQQIAIDPGFAFAAVFMGYRMLTGQEPLQPPNDGSENFDEELTAFLGQYYTFSKIAKNFENGGYNFKTLIKELVMSPYFRAINTAPDIDELQLTHLSGVGAAHLLTPEQLNRKIENVLGIRWASDEVGDNGQINYRTPNLLNGDPNAGEGYRILFGGIDSRDVTNRIVAPSGIMANVAERLGIEAGCKIVNAEFALPIEERRFFKTVELSHEPQDSNFYDVPLSIEAIKTDIQYLHKKLLGEKLELGDPEITRTYQVFVDVWKDGKTNVVPIDTFFPEECVAFRNYQTGETIPEELRVSDDGLYTGRAWGAVMVYLLTDYSFLYE